MSEAGQYSKLDKLLHKLAFRSVFLQKAVADIEDNMFAAKLGEASTSRPVFITSLPRAGTTLLLEVLSCVDSFAAHTYREMPFVLCPMLWDQISGANRQDAELAPRAHGDGMDISFDSHEAFEEVVWKAFWQENYGKDRISIWDGNDREPEFEQFLRQHIRKIIALRNDGKSAVASSRYISKNNGNVARLRLLPKIFQDCKIVIPIRNPKDHLKSLVRQHERFIEIHTEDKFAYQYMSYLGHFEFGLTLRPFDFDGSNKNLPNLRAINYEFWLDYWTNAYTHILDVAKKTPQIHLVDYDQLCADPTNQLQQLGSALELADDELGQLLGQAARFRAPTDYSHTPHSSGEQQVSELYKRLIDQAI